MKKIAVSAIILAWAVFSASCDGRPEILGLLDSRQDGSAEAFVAELYIGINKDYLRGAGILAAAPDAELDAVPDSVKIKADGAIYHAAGSRVAHAAIDLDLAGHGLRVYLQGGGLYFENGGVLRIILDLLTAAGLIDLPAQRIFNELAAPGELVRADLRDLSWLGRPGSAFDISLSFEAREAEGAPALPDMAGALDFGQLRAQVARRLLSLPGHRYMELNLIISPDNYLHVFALRENGVSELLEPFKLNIDAPAVISGIAEDSGRFLTERILPARYILELMGDEVGWCDWLRRPFVPRRYYGRIYFYADIIDSRAYISLLQIIYPARYYVDTGAAGGYLEFRITRYD